MTQKKRIVATIGGLFVSVIAGLAWSGPLEFDFGAATFSNPTIVDDDFWPLSSLPSAVYFSESDDGCEVNQVVVSVATRASFGAPYDDIEAIIGEDSAQQAGVVILGSPGLFRSRSATMKTA